LKYDTRAHFTSKMEFIYRTYKMKFVSIQDEIVLVSNGYIEDWESERIFVSVLVLLPCSSMQHCIGLLGWEVSYIKPISSLKCEGCVRD